MIVYLACFFSLFFQFLHFSFDIFYIFSLFVRIPTVLLRRLLFCIKRKIKSYFILFKPSNNLFFVNSYNANMRIRIISVDFLVLHSVLLKMSLHLKTVDFLKFKWNLLFQIFFRKHDLILILLRRQAGRYYVLRTNVILVERLVFIIHRSLRFTRWHGQRVQSRVWLWLINSWLLNRLFVNPLHKSLDFCFLRF